MKIVIFENTDKLHAVETAAQTAELLTAGGAELLTFNINELSDAAAVIDGTDIIIVIGGDGTILKTAPLACEYDIPLLGINTGRLGFMASIERTELHLLDKLIDGSFSLSRRLRLVGEVWRGDEKITELGATNEISAVHPISKITDFTVRAKDNVPGCGAQTEYGGQTEYGFRTVCGFRADGLLIATPTGSTAYALANGGAIIEPNAVCMELTPICAHTLSMRPMIFSAETIIEITHDLPVPFNKDEPVRIFADGVAACEMTAGDTLYIRKSDKPLRLIDLKPNAFYESVNGKLFQSLK